MLMMHAPATSDPAQGIMSWKPEEIQAHIGFMKQLNAELKAAGELVGAEGLDFPPKPKIVKFRGNGKPTITDGPFAETKEFLVGFWIVDVADEARAVEIAAKASTAPGPGGQPVGIPIEVRQVMAAPPK
jgi:hypothetical protein